MIAERTWSPVGNYFTPVRDSIALYRIGIGISIGDTGPVFTLLVSDQYQILLYAKTEIIILVMLTIKKIKI